MTDMLQQARERHDQIVKAISQHEAEIDKLKEEAEKLEHFAALAKELFAQKAEKAPERPAQPDAVAPSNAAPSAPQPPQAPVEAQQQRVMPMRSPQSA